MFKWLLLPLSAAALQGAVLRGVVLENQTGRPLFRATVDVQPASGSVGAAKSVRTDVSGAFAVADLPPGPYLVFASRPGFRRTQYGQRQWNSAGRPVDVAESPAAYIEIRLPRFGSITGSVLDEEDIGLPGHEVVAYKNTRPPELAAHATADDRGIYRLTGLEPGTYLVRTIGRQYPEGSYVPTFGKDTIPVDQAQTFTVDLDRTTEGADIRPIQGKLYTVDGDVGPLPPGSVATVTFVSDTGRQTMKTTGYFRFPPVPKGNYEIYAVAPRSDRAYLNGGYLKFEVSHDTSVHVRLFDVQYSRIAVAVGNGPPMNSAGFQVLARRRDLAGVSDPRVIKLGEEDVELPPGLWELMLAPIPGYYVESVSGNQAREVVPGRPEGWNEIQVQRYTFVRFSLSNHPGSIHGAVLDSEGKPAVGVPVFIEPYDNQMRQRILAPRSVTADSQGRYGVGNLPPGTYRVLATFEYQSPDADIFDRAPVATIEVEQGRDKTLPLNLWELR